MHLPHEPASEVTKQELGAKVPNLYTEATACR